MSQKNFHERLMSIIVKKFVKSEEFDLKVGRMNSGQS